MKIVGTLSPQPPLSKERSARLLEPFGKLGWVVGKNLAFERPLGQEHDLPQMAASLVQKRVDVIWAIGPEATVAAMRAPQDIPIVFWGVPDPVEFGVATSLARPGRNATGVAFFAGMELFSKQMELLRLVAPNATRLAWLSTLSANRTMSGELLYAAYREVERAAKSLGFDFRRHLLEKEVDLDAAFADIAASRPHALGVSGTTLTWRMRERIVDFAQRARLPSAFNQAEFVEEGGLFSYGTNTTETINRTSYYIDRVLRGARPAELPIELPSRYEFVVNLRTAAALRISIPDSILVRADKVIR